MTKIKNIVPFLFEKLLSENTREKTEKIILKVALISFFLHLGLILFLKFNFINFLSNSELLKSPISAIYTPFSFILIYEVYLLIYYLPKSFTTYITKQYECGTISLAGDNKRETPLAERHRGLNLVLYSLGRNQGDASCRLYSTALSNVGMRLFSASCRYACHSRPKR